MKVKWGCCAVFARVASCVGTLVALAVFVPPVAALGHGPCTCLDPVVTGAGDEVRVTDSARRQAGGVGYPVYRVMFNPRPSDFGIAPGYLASAYRADAPTRDVLSRSRHNPSRRGRFRIPKGAPAGLYMVLIWDGEEGGAHNSWDYLHVVARDEPVGLGVVGQQEEPPDSAMRNGPAREESNSDATIRWPLIAGISVGALLLGAAAGRAIPRRRPRRL